jgi:hypothetical protein
MRMSTTATSGGLSVTACSRATASLTARVTAKPLYVSTWTKPSRRIAESSAITTVMESTPAMLRVREQVDGDGGRTAERAGDAEVAVDAVDAADPVGEAG